MTQVYLDGKEAAPPIASNVEKIHHLSFWLPPGGKGTTLGEYERKSAPLRTVRERSLRESAMKHDCSFASTPPSIVAAFLILLVEASHFHPSLGRCLKRED